MTLLITVIAAVFTTVKWYYDGNDRLRLGFLVAMYWGASLMWFVDAVFEYTELRAEYFSPAPYDMLNDAFLGISVVALGLVIWLGSLLVKDPEGRIRDILSKKSERSRNIGGK